MTCADCIVLACAANCSSQIASRVWETLYEKARARVALAQEQERKQAAADQACLALIMEEVVRCICARGQGVLRREAFVEVHSI